MKELIIAENEAGQRFDKFLKKYLDRATAGFIYKMLRKKNITLNGRKAEGREILQGGDHVRVFFSDETMAKFHSTASQKLDNMAGKTANLHLAYLDEDILAVNKPAGMLTQRGNGPELSLSEYLPEYLLRQGKVTPQSLRAFRPSPVNRLDRNTSGLVLCGRTLKGQQFLSEKIRRRDVGKEYLCLARGQMTAPVTAKLFYRKDEKENRVILSGHDEKGMGTMETKFYPVAVNEEATLTRAVLVTGKTHQIRATLAYLGHPILGDPKYGDAGANRVFLGKTGVKRQMLHAFRISFPKTEGTFSRLSGKTIEAALPDDFQRALKSYGLPEASTEHFSSDRRYCDE